MTHSRASGTLTHRADAIRHNVVVGLHAVTEINQTIRYADTKAAALAGIQALAVTTLVARRGTADMSLPADLLYAACLIGVMISAALLAAAQAPRLTSVRRPSERPNRTAFPSLAEMRRADVLMTPTLKAQQEDVWRQAADLAAIAVTKYRWVHRAMMSTLATITAVLLWLGVTTWLR